MINSSSEEIKFKNQLQLFDPSDIPKNQGYPSNSIIKVKNQKLTYYLPCYLRMKMKNLNSFDLQSLNASLNATLLISIYYGNLPLEIAQQIQQKFSLRFQRQEQICFGFQQEEEMKSKISSEIKKKLKYVDFRIRKEFSLSIDSNVRFSPFQTHKLILTIIVNSLKVKWPQSKHSQAKYVQIKFNMMDCCQDSDFNQRLSYGEYKMQFGYYNIAQKLRQVHYTNKSTYTKFITEKNKTPEQRQIDRQKKQQQQKKKGSKIEQQKIQCLQYVHFVIPFYKFPGVSLMVIFLPLFLLSIINLGVFFQDFTISQRVESIAVLGIAFVAILPLIRQQIPPAPYLTLFQYIVYWATLGTVLSLTQSLRVRNFTQDDYHWYDIALLYVSIFITVTSSIIIVIFFLIHKFYWQGQYTDKNFESEDGRIDITIWNKQDTNEQYKQWIESLKKKKQKKKQQGNISPSSRLKLKNKIKVYRVPPSIKTIVSKSFQFPKNQEQYNQFKKTFINFIENSTLDALLLQGVSKNWLRNTENKKIIQLEEVEIGDVNQQEIVMKLSSKKVLRQAKLEANVEYTIVFNNEIQKEVFYAIIIKHNSFMKVQYQSKSYKKLNLDHILKDERLAWLIVDQSVVLISCFQAKQFQIMQEFQKQIKDESNVVFIIGMDDYSNSQKGKKLELLLSNHYEQQITNKKLQDFDRIKKFKKKPKQKKQKKKKKQKK